MVYTTFVELPYIITFLAECFNRGANISASNVTGNTPLMTAIIAGNVEVLLHMLKAINEGENIPFRDILSLNAKNNKTILIWAIENNHTILIEVSSCINISIVAQCHIFITLL